MLLAETVLRSEEARISSMMALYETSCSGGTVDHVLVLLKKLMH